jgi:hypothetical protein
LGRTFGVPSTPRWQEAHALNLLRDHSGCRESRCLIARARVLGTLLLIAALFLADSIGTLLRLFPMPVLGVILFFGGLELASSVASDGFSPAERTVLVVTAGLALWNMGAAYLAGLVLHQAWERRLIKL